MRARDRSGYQMVAPHAGQITPRGDTDFTLTGELDRWDGQRVKFIFGMDGHTKVVNLAEALPQEAWKPLSGSRAMKLPRVRDASPERVKASIVRFKGYENKVLVAEDIAEVEYQPLKSSRPYRLIIVRKNTSVQKGEQVLFDEVKQTVEMAFKHMGHLLDFVELASDRPGLPLFENPLSFFEGFALPEGAEACLDGPGSRSVQIRVFQSLEVRHALFWKIVRVEKKELASALEPVVALWR